MYTFIIYLQVSTKYLTPSINLTFFYIYFSIVPGGISGSSKNLTDFF